jgi:hypothetical protein
VILVKEEAGDKPIVQLVSEKDGNPKTGFAPKDKEHESTFRHFKMLAVSGSP